MLQAWITSFVCCTDFETVLISIIKQLKPHCEKQSQRSSSSIVIIVTAQENGIFLRWCNDCEFIWSTNLKCLHFGQNHYIPRNRRLAKGFYCRIPMCEVRNDYYTGYSMGTNRPIQFCREHKLKKTTPLFCWGIVGANLLWRPREAIVKKALMRVLQRFSAYTEIMNAAFFHSIVSYEEWNGGRVWFEDAYPNLLFAKDERFSL